MYIWSPKTHKNVNIVLSIIVRKFEITIKVINKIMDN